MTARRQINEVRLFRQGAIQMRNNRHSAIAAVIALPWGGAGKPAAAQRHRGHHDGAMGDKMEKELNLTADQQAKMKQLMDADRAKMQALRRDQTLTKDQKMEQTRALHETMKKDMDSIL